METFIGKAAEYAGDAVESALKKACGVKEKDKKKGGMLSFLGGGKDKEDNSKKGSLFSFGDDKKKDDGKGGIFSKISDKNDDKGTDKKSGFKGLFTEQEGATGGSANEEMPTFDEGSNPGAGVNIGDDFNDLMAVADEMSKGK